MELPELTTIERLPPQNVEAEQAVLGSMLLESEAIARSAELLDESSFYKDTHRKIFAALIALYRNDAPVDLVTVTEELRQRRHLEEIGGASYLATLTSVVPTAANAEYYCRIVKQKAVLRDLIRVSTQIATDCYETSHDPDLLLDKAEMQIFDIA
ncbi:MAG: replicative DNA helicase, partial [Candidatus Omnitrophica bacterium]|nr:replicative DNA helicase [Candidatus Omnitrophota bacterium]